MLVTLRITRTAKSRGDALPAKHGDRRSIIQTYPEQGEKKILLYTEVQFRYPVLRELKAGTSQTTDRLHLHGSNTDNMFCISTVVA
jgi:hypothetical protein